MDTTILRHFLTIAREGSMTAAANELHISQPTLSVQMKQLEDTLGKKVFQKQGRNLVLTEEGVLLRKRAEDILSLVDKTMQEFQDMDNLIGGEIRFGCAETYLVHHIATVFHDLQLQYPLLHFHITSGNTEQVIERIERGILDFALIVEPPSLDNFNYIELPGTDTYGVLMRPDHPLAAKQAIVFDDLVSENLIASEQTIQNDISRWCGEKVNQLNFIGNVNLFYNGSQFVKNGVGLQLIFEHLVPQCDELIWRPLSPKLETRCYIVWKKYQIFTPITEIFIKALTNLLVA